ncbi:MAG: NHL repeat-containing protein [Candidatus Schekmanbacteria bacterium]|nr:NHL repeat-containing protein [Candidatus Schekmanbacteria bacterium]
MSAACWQPLPLNRPTGVAAVPDGSVYVLDNGNHRVVRLAASGELLGAFGRLGTRGGDLFKSWDLTLDARGNLYLCNKIPADGGRDRAHDGALVFSPEGELLREIGGADYGKDDVQRHPYGIALDDDGRVYVADNGTNTLRVFAAAGTLQRTFFGKAGTGAGLFLQVTDVAVHSPGHLVYVLDSTNSYYQQFQLEILPAGELELTYRQTVGAYGRGPGELAHPIALAVDRASGTVYVGDMANRRIQAFSAAGQFLRELALPRKQEWQIVNLAVGAKGEVYAVDALANAVWVFAPDGTLRRKLGP